MNKAFKSFAGALKLHLIDGELLEIIYLTIRGFIYFVRLLKYEWFWPQKCKNCGGETKVYFMRPQSFIDGSDKTDIADWLICQHCFMAIGLP